MYKKIMKFINIFSNKIKILYKRWNYYYQWNGNEKKDT